MIDYIISQFSEISKKAIKRYSSSYNTTPQNVQLSFSLAPEGKDDFQVVYRMYNNYKKIEDVTFLNILGTKLDIRGYSFIAPPFIKNTLVRFANELSVGYQNVFVMLFLDEENNLMFSLYNLGQHIKNFQIEELFTNET